MTSESATSTPSATALSEGVWRVLYFHSKREETGGFPFRTMEDIVAAAGAIREDYPKHAKAAHEIAREYFEAEKVLASLLERAGV